MAFTALPTTLVYHPRQDGCLSTVFSPISPGPKYDTCTLRPTEVVVPCGAFIPSHICPASKDTSQTSVIATMRLASRVASYGDPSSSESSSGNLTGGKIAAIAIGTLLAVGLVCLLFNPHFLFTRLLVSHSRYRPSKSERVPLEDPPPQRPSRTSGDDGSNGADDAGRRRRYPEVVPGGRTRPHGNDIMIGRPSGSPIIINNNIYINSTDYLQPLPALNSQRNRTLAPPALRTPRNTQPTSGIHDVQFGPPPNGGIPPQRRRRGEPRGPPPRAFTAERPEASGFWNVGDWVGSVAPGQMPRSPASGRIGIPLGGSEQPPVQERERSSTSQRAFHVPGAFAEDEDAAESFQLITAPARGHAPEAPTHGDKGFWVRKAQENRWRRQEREDRRDRQEREDKRERQEREERLERDKHEREERRELNRLEREAGRERQEREERRERQEREDRRERQDEMR